MQPTNWFEEADLDNMDYLYDTLHKIRHTNRFERYFPSSGKRRPKYYSPSRNGDQVVQ